MLPFCMPIAQHATSEQGQMHTVSHRHAAVNSINHTACQTDTHFRTRPDAQHVRQTCPSKVSEDSELRCRGVVLSKMQV